MIDFKIIIVLITTIIILCFYYYKRKDENFTPNNEITSFINNDSKRKLKIKLTEQEFNQIQDSQYCLYYFPNKCPNYDEDIFLVESTNDGDRYYLPESETLLKITCNHTWSNKFEGDFLFKDSNLKLKYTKNE